MKAMDNMALKVIEISTFCILNDILKQLRKENILTVEEFALALLRDLDNRGGLEGTNLCERYLDTQND